MELRTAIKHGGSCQGIPDPIQENGIHDDTITARKAALMEAKNLCVKMLWLDRHLSERVQMTRAPNLDASRNSNLIREGFYYSKLMILPKSRWRDLIRNPDRYRSFG